MNHTWITIAEFPQYQINENGTVRHSITLNERKATVGKRGYVKLHKNLDLSDKIIIAMENGERIIAKVRD